MVWLLWFLTHKQTIKLKIAIYVPRDIKSIESNDRDFTKEIKWLSSESGEYLRGNLEEEEYIEGE